MTYIFFRLLDTPVPVMNSDDSGSVKITETFKNAEAFLNAGAQNTG